MRSEFATSLQQIISRWWYLPIMKGRSFDILMKPMCSEK